MTAWQISPGAQRLDLKDGRGEVVFTVSNPGPVDRRATVEIVGSDQVQSSWFKVAEPQQVVPLSGSKQFTAVVEPGDAAPAGTHWLAGRVYSADIAPEEDSVTSDRITFEIKPPAEKPKSKLWLWALIAGALTLVVVVGLVLVLVLKDGEPEVSTVSVPDVKTRTQAEAERLIKDAGLVPQLKEEANDTVGEGLVISQVPDGGTAAKESSVIITVSTGPVIVTPPPPPQPNAMPKLVGRLSIPVVDLLACTQLEGADHCLGFLGPDTLNAIGPDARSLADFFVEVFRHGAKFEPVGDPNRPGSRIRSQTPAPGVPVEPFSTFTVEYTP
jgi:hypothetical protein